MSTPLGIKIRRARDAKGWTRRELAIKADIVYTTLSNIEVPKRKKNVKTSEANLRKLADVLDLDFDELRILAGYLGTRSANMDDAREQLAIELSAHRELEKAIRTILRRGDRQEIDQATEYLRFLGSRHNQ